MTTTHTQAIPEKEFILPLPKIKMIATGGTIAMKLDPQTLAPVPAISGDMLLNTVPEISDIADIDIENFSNIPSDYITPRDWVALHKSVTQALENPDICGVIISHGTDTLEETAYFLNITTKSPKPIVLFGAQRNASSRDADGPRNLINATRVAACQRHEGRVLWS